jgi:hypothetical protein
MAIFNDESLACDSVEMVLDSIGGWGGARWRAAGGERAEGQTVIIWRYPPYISAIIGVNSLGPSLLARGGGYMS